MHNTAVGDQALVINAGASNTATGFGSLMSNTTGNFNTANGGFCALATQHPPARAPHGLRFSNAPELYRWLPISRGTRPLALERSVNDTVGNFNTAVGDSALKLNTTGGSNTAIGLDALVFNDTGSQNTATGANALFHNTGGLGNTANGTNALFTNATGNQNTSVGFSTLSLNVTGSNNTAIGFQTLLNSIGAGNTALGVNAGSSLTTGDNNIDIGNRGVAGESSTIRIGELTVHTGIFLAGITAMTPAAPNQAMLVDPTTGQLGNGGSGQLSRSTRANRRYGRNWPHWANRSDRRYGRNWPHWSNRRYGRNRPQRATRSNGSDRFSRRYGRNGPQWVNGSNRSYGRDWSWGGYYGCE